MIWLKRLGVWLLSGLLTLGALFCLERAGLPTIWNWWCLGAVTLFSAATSLPAPWDIKRPAPRANYGAWVRKDGRP